MKFYSSKSVLVTGGLGFIGSNLARELVRLGADVTVADVNLPGSGANAYNLNGVDKVTVHKINIGSEDTAAVVKGKDIIFNLAGQLSHVGSIANPCTDLEANCAAQLVFLETCRKHNPDAKILFTGTRAQYGKARYLPVDENHPMNPNDINGINKLAGELYHLLYFKLYGLKTCVARLTNAYGPRQYVRENTQGFMPWFIRLAVDNKTINLFGDGSQLRDVVYVDDVVNALLVLMADERSKGNAYNIGSGHAYSVNEIAKTIVEVAGKGDINYIDFPEVYKKVEVGNFYLDISKIKGLGWQPETVLKDGLKKTIAFYTKNRGFYW